MFDAFRRGEVVAAPCGPEMLPTCRPEVSKRTSSATGAELKHGRPKADDFVSTSHLRKRSITVEEACRLYLADPGAPRSTKTLHAYRSTFALLAELVGPDTPIRALSREKCRSILDTLRLQPPNATKRHRGSRVDAASRMSSSEMVPMRPATVNSYLNRLSALMKWSICEGFLEKNPAQGLRVVDPIRKRDKRHPFSEKQLHLIFDSPLYRGCENDQAGYARPGGERPRRARFWVPLIGLFSGMRLNEICQMDTVDIRLIDGVLCFLVTTEDFQGGTTKRLKTNNAERIVPVHPTLIELGFHEFQDERRRSPSSKLFPELTIASTGYYSDNFSKWFSIFLEKAGAKTARTSFHSFRHNFRDELRDARIDRDIAYALCGWGAEGSVTAENYGRGFGVSVLFHAVSATSSKDWLIRHLKIR